MSENVCEIVPQLYSVRREVVLCDPSQRNVLDEQLAQLVAITGVNYAAKNRANYIRVLPVGVYKETLSQGVLDPETAEKGLLDYIEGASQSFIRTTIRKVILNGPQDSNRYLSFEMSRPVKSQLKSETNTLLSMIGSPKNSLPTPPITLLNCMPAKGQLALDRVNELGLVGSEILITPPIPIKVNG